MKFDRKKLALIFRQRQTGKENESRTDVRMMPRSKDNENAIDAIRKIINKYKGNSDIRKSLANRAGEYFRKSIEDHGFVEESVELEERNKPDVEWGFVSSVDQEGKVIARHIRKDGKLTTVRSTQRWPSKKLGFKQNPNTDPDGTSLT